VEGSGIAGSNSPPRAEFELAPALTLAVTGPAADVRHFLDEYGPRRIALPSGAEPSLTVELQASLGPGSRAWSDGHKSVRWHIGLSSGPTPAHAGIRLGGAPRSFARSLVQGYVVEPLLSVLAAERGSVLLPAAGIVDGRGLHVLIGRSRAGKSTVAARTLAAGGQILGEHQVVATPSGAWQAFPRRLRLYPDLRETAPQVWRRLPFRARAVLVGRRLLEVFTRGTVRPSLAVDARVLGARFDPGPRRAVRIVLLERGADIDRVEVAASSVAEAVAWSQAILEEQRARLARHAPGDWVERLAAVPRLEAAVLSEAMTGVPVERVRLPGAWAAPRAVDAAARTLGFDPG